MVLDTSVCVDLLRERGRGENGPAHLLRSGTPIPVMDLLIGITAKARSLPVLTRDVTHFSRIPGLVVEEY